MITTKYSLPVSRDSFHGSIVSSKRKIEPDHSIACFDDFEILVRYFCLVGCSVEEQLDLFQESRLLKFIDLSRTILSRI
jgi:hypothetical protein